jgi:hypothetical protein
MPMQTVTIATVRTPMQTVTTATVHSGSGHCLHRRSPVFVSKRSLLFVSKRLFQSQAW